MRTEIRTCEHCGTQYSYYLSGVSPDGINDGKYCHSCWKKIKDALNEIPKKFTGYYCDIKNIKFLSIDYEKDLEPLKKKYIEEETKRKSEPYYLPSVMKVYPRCINTDKSKEDSTITEEYIYIKIQHIMSVIRIIIRKKRQYAYGEYDLENKKFTGKQFIENELLMSENCFIHTNLDGIVEELSTKEKTIDFSDISAGSVYAMLTSVQKISLVDFKSNIDKFRGSVKGLFDYNNQKK